jgi:hypothetical protein
VIDYENFVTVEKQKIAQGKPMLAQRFVIERAGATVVPVYRTGAQI